MCNLIGSLVGKINNEKDVLNFSTVYGVVTETIKEFLFRNCFLIMNCDVFYFELESILQLVY